MRADANKVDALPDNPHSQAVDKPQSPNVGPSNELGTPDASRLSRDEEDSQNSTDFSTSPRQNMKSPWYIEFHRANLVTVHKPAASHREVLSVSLAEVQRMRLRRMQRELVLATSFM